jgi:hypothetical protein
VIKKSISSFTIVGLSEIKLFIKIKWGFKTNDLSSTRNKGKTFVKNIKIAVIAMVLAIQCNENVRKWLVFVLTHGDSAILCQS